MEIAQKIDEFIQTELLAESVELHGNTSLFQGGLIDSMNLVQLLAFLESEFTIKVPPSAVSVENLDTIESMARLVSQLQG